MPNLPYTLDIPLSTSVPAQIQPQLRQNCNSIDTLIDVDHNTFAVNDDYGKHKKVTWPRLGAAPTFTENELGVYNLLFSTGANPSNLSELYIKRDGEDAIPFTATNLHGGAGDQSGRNGYCYLPSGLLMQWGQTPAVSIANTAEATFLRPFRLFASSAGEQTYRLIYTASATGGTPPVAFAGVTVSATAGDITNLRARFRFQGSLPTNAGATQYVVNWVAIGRPGAI